MAEKENNDNRIAELESIVEEKTLTHKTIDGLFLHFDYMMERISTNENLLLSMKEIKTYMELIDLIIMFGIHPYMSVSISSALKKRSRFKSNSTTPTNVSDHETLWKNLQHVLHVFSHDSLIVNLVLKYYFHDIFAAILTLNKEDHDSRSIDKFMSMSSREEIFKSLFYFMCVAKADVEFCKVCGVSLSKYMMKDRGIFYLIRSLNSTCSNTGVDAEKCDRLTSVILHKPSSASNEREYFMNIINQINLILCSPNILGLHPNFHNIFSQVVGNIFDKDRNIVLEHLVGFLFFYADYIINLEDDNFLKDKYFVVSHEVYSQGILNNEFGILMVEKHLYFLINRFRSFFTIFSHRKDILGSVNRYFSFLLELLLASRYHSSKLSGDLEDLVLSYYQNMDKEDFANLLVTFVKEKTSSGYVHNFRIRKTIEGELEVLEKTPQNGQDHMIKIGIESQNIPYEDFWIDDLTGFVLEKFERIVFCVFVALLRHYFGVLKENDGRAGVFADFVMVFSERIQHSISDKNAKEVLVFSLEALELENNQEILSVLLNIVLVSINHETEPFMFDRIKMYHKLHYESMDTPSKQLMVEVLDKIKLLETHGKEIESTTNTDEIYIRFQECLSDIHNNEAFLKGHGFITLSRLIRENATSPLVKSNISTIIEDIMLGLIHEDTYVHLNAIKCVATITTTYPEVYLKRFVVLFNTSDWNIELMQRVGEAISISIRELDPIILSKYSELLVGNLLGYFGEAQQTMSTGHPNFESQSCCYKDLQLTVLSIMSCICEKSTLSVIKSLPVLFEICFSVMEQTTHHHGYLERQDAISSRKAALSVFKFAIYNLGEDTFHVISNNRIGVLSKIYKTCMTISGNILEDQIVRNHSSEIVELIDGITKKKLTDHFWSF